MVTPKNAVSNIKLILNKYNYYIISIIIFQGGDMDSCNYKALTSRQYSVKRLSEKFNVVSMKDTFRSSENVFIENEAFQELKDDDL